MGDLKHLVLVKFKEETVVKDLVQDMEKLVSDISTVKSLEWGENAQGADVLTQGFTHIFIMTFSSEEDYAAYSNHPSHLEFAGKFAAAIDKILLFHFPATAAKPSQT